MASKAMDYDSIVNTVINANYYDGYADGDVRDAVILVQKLKKLGYEETETTTPCSVAAYEVTLMSGFRRVCVSAIPMRTELGGAFVSVLVYTDHGDNEEEAAREEEKGEEEGEEEEAEEVYYKIWVQIERCDYDNDDYQNIGEPVDIASYSTEARAEEALQALCEHYGVKR